MISITISCFLGNSFAYKSTKCAFKNKEDENPLAIANEAWHLKAVRLIGDLEL